MNQVKKEEILTVLNQEIKKAQGIAKKRRETAKEFKSASRSQQGDRRYFEDADLIAQSYLARLLELKEEITSTPNQSPEKVESVSYVAVKHEDGETSSFYFVQRGINLPGLQLVTPESPLGKAVEGKREGVSFSYQIERDGQVFSYSGQIKKIE